jgi:hypothetical protein
MRLRLLLTAALATLAVATPASAYVLDAGTGPFTNPPVGGPGAQVPIGGSAVAQNPLIAELMRAGIRYWEGYPQSCAGGLAVNLSTDDPDAGDDTVYNGWVYDEDPCVMYLNVRNAQWPITRRNALDWCSIVTHEMGHMLGLDHSRDKRNIMTGDWIPNASPDCNVFRRKGQAKAQPRLRDPFYDKAGNHLTPQQRAARLG